MMTSLWAILAMQTVFLGICFMADSEASKNRQLPGSFFRNWWRTIVSFILLIIDCGLLGFVKGIEPYVGGN